MEMAVRTIICSQHFRFAMLLLGRSQLCAFVKFIKQADMC